MKKGNFFNRILRLRNDNAGSAIVIVIIAMAMIGILAATIGWSSYINFKIKMNDRRTKISFYQAEKALDQILAGLQNESEVSLRASYDNVMRNWAYDEESGIRSHSDRFGEDFLTALWKSLDAEGKSFNFRSATPIKSSVAVDTLRQFVDDTTKTHIVFCDDAGNTATSFEMEYDAKSANIVIKGVGIEYEDDNHYVSRIITDYEMVTPDLAFNQELPISDVLDGNYYLIGSEGIEVTGAGELLLNCNAYAGVNEYGKGGIMVGTGVHKTDAEGEKTDEFASSEVGRLTLGEKCETLLSPGDVELINTGSRFKIANVPAGVPSSEVNPRAIYVNGVVLNGGEFTMEDKCEDVSLFFQNDLELRGSGSVVDLKSGNLYGYGNGNSADPSSVSSSIILNGTNSKLHLGVKNLMLAGTAYVGNHRNANGKEYDFDPCRMGESITVKGGQIAYLAPAECIMEVTDDDNEAVVGYLGRNPVNYVDLSSKGTKAKCDFDKIIYKLGGESLASLGVSDIREFYDATSDMEYLYLVFSNDATAKEYFKAYYGYADENNKSTDAKQSIDTYVKKRYANEGIILDGVGPVNTNGTTSTLEGYEYRISGNVFTYDKGTTGKITRREFEYSEDTDMIDAIVKNKASMMSVANIFDYLIDEISIRKLSGATEFISPTGFIAVVTPGNYTVDDPNVRFVLAEGDITIPCDYQGCAYAKGTIKLKAGSGGHKIEPDAVGIYEAMNTVRETDALSPLSYFKKSPVTLSKYGMIKVEYSEIVKYRNWIKQ